ncbi:MAG: ribonuclease HI family protein [Desulfomonilaceae bacterium]|nr:ribonuclease HI family protein [Desulfomonilaceae bacterium]
MHYKAYFDGSSFLNHCGIGYVIRDPHGRPICKSARYAGRGDALKAEYMALTALIQRLASLRIQRATIHGDSRTVIGQVNGRMNTREKNRFRDVILYLRDLCREHPGWHLQWIPRAENGMADALATEGLSEARNPKCQTTRDDGRLRSVV